MESEKLPIYQVFRTAHFHGNGKSGLLLFSFWFSRRSVVGLIVRWSAIRRQKFISTRQNYFIRKKSDSGSGQLATSSPCVHETLVSEAFLIASRKRWHNSSLRSSAK
jgi:hypothetical protein